MLRRNHYVHLFCHQDPLFFQGFDSGLIGFDDRGIAGIDNALQQASDLMIDIFDLAFEISLPGFRMGQPMIPDGAENGGDQTGQIAVGLQAFENLSKTILYLCLRDRFAFRRAVSRDAQIIAIVPAEAFSYGSMGLMHRIGESRVSKRGRHGCGATMKAV